MESPLISVVVISYNHGRYLSKAIDSVLIQDYKSIEIVVVDDGSTDNTKSITTQYPSVHYIYQANKGASAARNKGIECSSGEYLLFLDADDWLLPGALSINSQILQLNPEVAFVSGAFKTVKEVNNETIETQFDVKEDHYIHLLQFNYISMIATVLFTRWVLYEFQFDTTLKYCEDYDLYLRIARKYPILHHTEFCAAYRFHNSNTSYNSLGMMKAALQILERQKPCLRSELEKKFFSRGIKNWKLFYSKVIYGKYLLQSHKNNVNKKAELHYLWMNSKALYLRFRLKKLFYVVKDFG